MKKLLTVILFTILYCSAFAQIHITAGDGKLEFDIPDNELVSADFYEKVKRVSASITPLQNVAFFALYTNSFPKTTQIATVNFS